MNRSKILEETRRVGWLAEQKESLREAMLARTELRERAIGEIIYLQGEPPGGVYGLASGSLNVVAALGPFMPRLVHVARPGWWVGEASMVSRTRTRVDITARAPSVIAVISAAAINDLARQHPDIWRALGRLTVDHMDNALLLAGCLLETDARNRIIGTLLRLSLPTPPDRGPVELPVTQGELAEMAGLSRNPVGPVLRELEVAGKINCRRRRIRILDLAGLKRLVEP